MSDRSITRVLSDLSMATRDYILDGIVLQIIESSLMAKRSLGKSKGVDGGDRIRADLEVGEETIAWLGEWDSVTYTPKQILDAAYYDWKWLNGNITLSEKQVEVQNTGRAKLYSLVETKSKGLARTFKMGFSGLLFKNAAASAEQPATLYDIVVQNTTTLAGIDPSVYSWWQAKKLALPGTVTYQNWMTPGNTYYIEDVIRYMFGNLTNDADMPTLIVTTQAIFDDYEKILHSQNRYRQAEGTFDGAFKILEFRGTPIAVDSHVPTGHMYLLNENYLGFRHSTNINFRMSDFEKVSTGQHAYASELDWYGAYVCTNRAFQGVITGIPVSGLSLS